MAKSPRIKTTLADALDVQTVWQAIPDFKMGDVTLNDFTAAAKAADELSKQHVNSGVERAGLKANRDDKIRQVSELITRFRSQVRGTYGPNSALYEQAGGTRSSLRKSPKRKAVPGSKPLPPGPEMSANAPAAHA